MPEQAAGDGKGHLYIDVEDKENIAVVDTKTLDVTAHYDLAGKGGTCAYRDGRKEPHSIRGVPQSRQHGDLNANDGSVITTLPIGMGTDGATFNPKTMEAFSSQGADGTLTIVKENSPIALRRGADVADDGNAARRAPDTKTNHIILIAAEVGPPTPPAQPGGRAGRG